MPREMTAYETQPIEPVDTAELELPPPTEPPDDEIDDPARPAWEPDDGDFT